MRTLTAVVAVSLAFALGWTLGDARVPQVEYRVAVRQVPMPTMRTAPTWAEALTWETPLVDALVDWDDLERETDCLWAFLKDRGADITLEVVLAAGEWTDAMGGACQVMGR